MYGLDVYSSDVMGLVGVPVEVRLDTEFDEARITFSYDEDALGDISEENLRVMWYDEENQRFVELDTVLDGENETVSVTTTHFSKYMIVDRTVWYEAWEKEIDYNPGSSVTTYYTVLAIDCSGSMKGNDPIIYNNNISSAYDSVYNRKKCNRIHGALEYVDGMSAGDKVAVVFFDSSAEVVLDFTDDKEAVKLALQGIYNSGNTSFNAALKTSFSLFDQSVLDDETICTRVVFLSDGESSYDKKYITTAQNNDIIIHGIGLGGSSDDEALADMSVSTGGVFQKADKSEMLSELYEKIYIYDQFDKTDTDGDGLYDIVETAGIRLCNGQIIYTNPNLPDSDGDELDDGVEIDPVPRYSDMKWIKDENVGRSPGLVFWFSSNPELIDTDFDNATDAEDFTPREYNEFISYIFYPEVGEFYLEYEANVRYKRMINIYGKTVQRFETTDIGDFKEHWNQMGMKGGKIAFQIDEVHFIYHGGPRNVCIATQGWLYADNNELDVLENKYNERNGDLVIDDLEKKKISYLNLSSCNNGNIDFMSNKGIEGINDNMAISFLKSKHDIDLVSAWDGKSNYFGVFLGNNDNYISFEIEMSTGDDDFQNWSMLVNGKERKPQQKLYYMKFGDEILCSRFKLEQR